MEPLARGDPESPLRWTNKSTRVLSAELIRLGHPISHEKVAQLLRSMDYSLQGNRKTEEGNDHPDRDAQFRHINEQVRRALAAGRPGYIRGHEEEGTRRELRKCGPTVAQGEVAAARQRTRLPRPVGAASLSVRHLRLGSERGFVNVGTDHDTGAFAVASIRGWWRFEGRRLYPNASRLLITADGGGSNGYRLRLWKLELQALADETDCLSWCVTSLRGRASGTRWNIGCSHSSPPIGAAEPLRDYETIVRLIAGTTTAKGLQVTCRLDRRRYSVGRKVSDQEFATINLKPHDFHGEWNYTIRPRTVR